MAHTKKKAAILSVASTLIGTSLVRIAGQEYIEAGILFAIAAVLFVLYEKYNLMEIPFSADELEDAADGAADEVNEQIDKRSE